MTARGARRRAKDHAMSDSVEHLRARWTPELTAAAIHQLQGQPAGIEVPTMQHDGRTFLDLRGIRTASASSRRSSTAHSCAT